MISGTFIDHRDTGRPEIHPSPVMSGANARSQNLPGSFNGFLAETGNSETDPVPEITGRRFIILWRLALNSGVDEKAQAIFAGSPSRGAVKCPSFLKPSMVQLFRIRVSYSKAVRILMFTTSSLLLASTKRPSIAPGGQIEPSAFEGVENLRPTVFRRVTATS